MKGTAKRASILATGMLGLIMLMIPNATAAKPGAGGGGGGKAGGVQFGAPVKVTPDLGFGYEPTVLVDRFGNIFSTAHKENWQLVLGPDLRSPTYTRSMSWDWVSVDNGATWKDIPGLTPASLEQHEFGDEGDMAIDDADHLYFVDTSVVDVSVTRWTMTGRDQIAIDYTRPFAPAAQPVDDRPWVTAHGSSSVFYVGNEGDKVTYTSPQRDGSGYGPGRYTVYQSYDGGQTFDPLGYTLNDSGWCRPASDHTASGRSKYVYVLCTNDGGSDDFSTPADPAGTLWAYVSADDGHTFSRYKVAGYKEGDPNNTTWPTVQVAPDGSIWALFDDRDKVGDGDDIQTQKLRLFHSTNHGQTWTEQDITPRVGKYVYSWLSISPDGKKLGIGTYFRPNADSDWFVYGAIFSPGQKPNLVLLDPVPVAPKNRTEPPADYMMSGFGPDGKLSVVWTRVVLAVEGAATLERDIYFARSL